MKEQNQIKRTLSEKKGLEHLCNILKNNQSLNRSELAGHVCREYNFYDTCGNMQLSGCLKALRELESSGHFTLPLPQKSAARGSPRRLAEPVPEPVNVPLKVGEIQKLKLVLVQTTDEMRIWNELMINEHPLGAGPLVGRQMRYLISSEYGWLGGFGFAAPALQLAARDKWIGWNSEQHQKFLHFIVGMSRFLIRPSVNCQNLASKVLSMSINRLVSDFEKRYNYRPLLLESFVDSDYSGTCYKASNWIKIGKTKGRGRQDRFNQYALSIKTIYVYPIETDFRQQMGLSENAGLGALKIADGLDGSEWAEHEFGGAQLGDNRLNKRLVSVAAAKAEDPGSAFSGTVKGSWPETKGYYRMIDQPEDSAVNLSNILAPHRKRTIRRMMDQKTVLCIQDGSELNYTNLDRCKDLGFLKSNQTGAKTMGLNLHSTLAVTTNGLPLGVLKSQAIAPKPKDSDDKRKPSSIPIEEKKSFLWIEHHRDLVELSREIPTTKLINVCDREADFFEMFDEQRKNPGVDMLIRAQHNRNIREEPFKLFEAVRQAPELSRISVSIPYMSARPKKSKQRKRAARPGRQAELAVRKIHIQLPPPEYYSDKAPIDIWLIHALEATPPMDTKAVEWFLLTTIDIISSEDAERCLRWYTLRWRIEDWHRVLKSGCRIDDLKHKTAERLRRAIGINLVIAWRIMLMTLLGRETPQLPAEILFSDIELKTLRAYAKKKALKPPTTLGEAVILVAKIGGYLDRKNDPPPGHQILWHGYAKLQTMSTGFALSEYW